MEYNHRFCVAPMLDWTDRHARYFYRLISKNALLYTEMVTTGAIIYGDRERHLQFDNFEQPVALQLGGSDPKDLVACAQIAQDYGYSEINLNVGCPSDRVQSGRFGACLMLEPDLVAECVASMQSAIAMPVTVKTRLGIDDLDDYEFVHKFVKTVSETGCDTFLLHARKAWLKGLSPKQNREVPPLQYEKVFQLKQDFPELTMVLNGGLKSHDDCLPVLEKLDGVMVGREVYQNPMILADVDQLYFQSAPRAIDRSEILATYLSYVDEQLNRDVYLKHMIPPLFGLFQGLPGTKAWKRYLSENAYKKDAGRWVVEEAALRAFSDETQAA
ncbi:MAG: tRNA-dihydrouridine synthase A [Parasphingorhabdus sp.]